jgi:type I restriction enzyme M protein
MAFAPIIIPEGASFKDMVAIKGKPDIGDQINKKIWFGVQFHWTPLWV